MNLDRATVYAILSRAWIAVSGPATLLFIALGTTPEDQGVYYLFGSLLALQTFFELGLSIVIVQFASHEWAKLKLEGLNEISGDSMAMSRLRHLVLWAQRWYAILSVIFLAVIGTAGYVFLALRAPANVAWKAQWFALIVLASLQLNLMALIAVLEGCNQVLNVYKFRTVQAVLSSVGLWLVLIADGKLWAPVVSLALNVGSMALFVTSRYRAAFESLMKAPQVAVVNWKEEIWPLQWRFALNGVVNYLLFSLYVPVIFEYVGAVRAGQAGMVIQIANAIQSIGTAVLLVRVPTFGNLIANTYYKRLDALFFRTTSQSVTIVTALSVLFVGIVWWLDHAGNALASRVLPPSEVSVFLAAMCIGQISNCLGYYLIAHKRNPMFIMAVTAGLANALLVVLLTRWADSLGAGLANLLVVMLLIVPWHFAIWTRCRRDWHNGQPT